MRPLAPRASPRGREKGAEIGRKEPQEGTMAEGGKAGASADEPAIPDPRLTAQGAISDEALRKAEEFVEQEEGAANRLTGWSATIVTSIAVAMTLFHLYAAYSIEPWDVAAAAASVMILAYAIWGGEDFTDRATTPAQLDVVLGVIFIVLLLEATRRTSGWIMPAVAILFIIYAMAGPYLPPPWTHRGYTLYRLVGHLFITLEGIFGVAVDVSSTLIIMFTIYGAFLQHSGSAKHRLQVPIQGEFAGSMAPGRAEILLRQGREDVRQARHRFLPSCPGLTRAALQSVSMSACCMDCRVKSGKDEE
jgi:hypothetical protein